MNCTLTVTSEATDTLRDALQIPLRAYNRAQAGPSNSEPLVVVVKDETGQPIGGAWGYTSFGWLAIQLMFVPEGVRGQGLGRKIMALAEATAVQRGCHDAWLDTHEFQAKGFYEKLGYEVFGQLPNYPPPFSRFFFKKRLSASNENAA